MIAKLKSSSIKMPIKKSKPKVTNEVIEIDIMRTDPAELAKFADTPEGKRSPFFSMPDGQGVTIGRSLGGDEYEGNGLPDWKNDRQLFAEIALNFTVRVTCDREGTTYLEIHQARHQSFYSFRFEGIEYKDLFSVVPDFEKRLSLFLINYGIFFLFNGLYWKGAEKKDRDEAYEAIIKSFENYFKSILKPKRKREIGTREINPGLKITTFETIDTGREPKTKAELEHEKSKFISDVFEALNKIESYNGPHTILETGNLMFPTSNNAKKTLDNKLTAYQLSWKNLKRDYKNLKNCN